MPFTDLELAMWLDTEVYIYEEIGDIWWRYFEKRETLTSAETLSL